MLTITRASTSTRVLAITRASTITRAPIRILAYASVAFDMPVHIHVAIDIHAPVPMDISAHLP